MKLKRLNFEKYSYFSYLPQGKNWLTIKELIPKILREDEALCDVNSICTLDASDMQEHLFFCLRICIPVLMLSVETSSLSGSKAALLHSSLPFAFGAKF